MTPPDWPRGIIVLSSLRVHIPGYPKKRDLGRILWKAVKLDMIVTIAPVVWGRLGKLWQKYLIPAVMSRGQVFNRVKRFFFFQIHQWRQIRDVQHDIYQLYGYKITIARLKWWIVRRRIGREPI